MPSKQILLVYELFCQQFFQFYKILNVLNLFLSIRFGEALNNLQSKTRTKKGIGLKRTD